MKRLGAFITKNKTRINEFHCTLDSHQEVHVAHPIFWLDSKGNHPAPFTLITDDDVRNAKWRCFNPKWQPRAQAYVDALKSKGLDQLNAGSGYKFSATRVKDLGASEYTLATIVVDASGSVAGFEDQLNQCLKTVFNACAKSPRRDNLMLRVIQFNTVLTELHGFKLLGSITEKDYDNILQIGGSTALFESMDEAVQATGTYGKSLTSQDFLCNAIVVVVTDGENNDGAIMDPAQVKKSLQQVRRSENLESILLILVGVTNDDVKLNTYLQTVKDDCGCDQYVSIGRATPGRVAKLAEFISQSISSTSSALANKTQSTPLNPASFKF
jgi:uncharacterized protein YegL